MYYFRMFVDGLNYSNWFPRRGFFLGPSAYGGNVLYASTRDPIGVTLVEPYP